MAQLRRKLESDPSGAGTLSLSWASVSASSRVEGRRLRPRYVVR
jgi:hypothetical protein